MLDCTCSKKVQRQVILPKTYFNGIILYITKVLECSWDELLTKVKEAEDFDNVIAAHQVFLNTVISRCLLDEQSRVRRYFISCDKFVILLEETLRYSD